MRWAVLLVTVAACGGGRATTWTPAPYPQHEKALDSWTTKEEDRWTVLACENLVDSSGDLRCEALDHDQFKADACVQSLGKLRAAATTFRSQMAYRALLALLASAKSCREVVDSFRQSMAMQYASATEIPATNCARDIVGPFSISPDEARRRRGSKAIRFSDMPSSPTMPIEVCGLSGELTWLTRTACQDGSLPWGKDFDRAHGARTGTKMMKVPRCADEEVVLDIYKVPCPEQTYEVYMDMYECAPGETF